MPLTDNRNHNKELIETRDYAIGLEEDKVPTKEDYKGSMRNGMRNGRGVCLYPNGDKYDGEWKDDLKDGRGKFVD